MTDFNKENLEGWAISNELHQWILNNIPKNSTILEFGSGTGTIELCKDYKVYSVEHNKEWLDKSDSNYIYAPIINYEEYRWYDIDVLKTKLPNSYDLILIDGPPGNIGREGFFHNSVMFNRDIPLIFDDTHRQPEKDLALKFAHHLGKKITHHNYPNKSFITL
jgi:hypothetical protein